MQENVMAMSGAYLRGGVNDTMINIHHTANSQQGNPIHSAPPSNPEPKSPKIPSPPSSPFNSTKIKSRLPSQIPRYTINTKLLKFMSK
jgi:hypothetical protein